MEQVEYKSRILHNAATRATEMTGTTVLSKPGVWYAPTPTRTVSTEPARPLRPRQQTWSHSNPWWLRTRSEYMRNRDIGSDFTTIRREYLSTGARSFHLERPEPGGYDFGRSVYDGPLYVDPTRSGYSSSFPEPLTLGVQTLQGMGSTAIARTIPTNPIAGAAVFLGELREGLPSMVGKSLWKSRLRDYRKIGDEYVNVQFGWKPMISDIQKFAEAARTSEKVLAQYRRDSGRNVRRRYEFPRVEERKVEVLDPTTTALAPYPCGGTIADHSYFSSGASQKLTRTTYTSYEVWFSGCFTYYLDPGDTALGRAKRASQEAAKLYGTRLTPETVWNLAPWSWAADWVTNLGDVIHNFAAFSSDGLVLRWGYVMEKTIHEVTHELTGLVPKNGNVPSTLSETRRTTRKSRIGATPYGFGIDMGNLNPSQYAILAALGISRGPRVGGR